MFVGGTSLLICVTELPGEIEVLTFCAETVINSPEHTINAIIDLSVFILSYSN